MLLTLDFPIQIGHTFRTKMINNFRTILNYYNELDHQHRAHTEAPTIYDDNITSQSELKKKLKETLDDIPTIEVATNFQSMRSL